MITVFLIIVFSAGVVQAVLTWRRARSADFDRVSAQLAQIRIFGRKLVAYAYWPYMQADLNAGANRLNNAYTDFVEETIEANIKVPPE